MDKILNSPFFQNLKDGKLPEVQVSLTDRGIATLAVSLVLVGLTLMVAKKLIDSI